MGILGIFAAACKALKGEGQQGAKDQNQGLASVEQSAGYGEKPAFEFLPNHCPVCNFDVGPEPVAPKPPGGAWTFIDSGHYNKATPYFNQPELKAAWEKYDADYEVYKAKVLADPFHRGGYEGRCPRCSAAFYRDAEGSK